MKKGHRPQSLSTLCEQGLILLDRDGVLNAMTVDPEQGTIDSPLHPDQVEILPGVPEAVAQLTRAGYRLAIVSNQPAWAKRKTTRKNLESVHYKIVRGAESGGGRIVSSHLCFHRAEDRCNCRKPRTGLLKEAIRKYPQSKKEKIWMVGDGVTDMQAGQALGLKTAFIAKWKNEVFQRLKQNNLSPTLWTDSLAHFARALLLTASGRQIKTIH